MNESINKLFDTVIPKSLDKTMTKGFGLFKEAYIELYKALVEDKDKHKFLGSREEFKKFIELPFLQKLLVINPMAYKSLIDNLYMTIGYPTENVNHSLDPMSILSQSNARQFSKVSYDIGSGLMSLPGQNQFEFNLQVKYLPSIDDTEDWRRENSTQSIFMNELFKIIDSLPTREQHGITRSLQQQNVRSASYIRLNRFNQWYYGEIGDNYSSSEIVSTLDITSFFSMFENVATMINNEHAFVKLRSKLFNMDKNVRTLMSQFDLYIEYIEDIIAVLNDDENTTSLISLPSDFWYIDLIRTIGISIGKFHEKFSSVRFQEDMLSKIIVELDKIQKEYKGGRNISALINNVPPLFNEMISSIMKPKTSDAQRTYGEGVYTIRFSNLLSDALNAYMAHETLAISNIEVDEKTSMLYLKESFLNYITDIELKENLSDLLFNLHDDDESYRIIARKNDYKYRYLMKNKSCIYSPIDAISHNIRNDKIEHSIIDVITGSMMVRIVRENIEAIYSGATDREHRIVHLLYKTGMRKLTNAYKRLSEILKPELYIDSLDTIDKAVLNLDDNHQSYITLKRLYTMVSRIDKFREVLTEMNSTKNNINLYDYYGISMVYFELRRFIEKLNAAADMNRNREEITNLADFGFESHDIDNLIFENNRIDYDKLLFSGESSFLDDVKGKVLSNIISIEDLKFELTVVQENVADFETLARLSTHILGIEERANVTGNKLSEEDSNSLEEIKSGLAEQYVGLANEISEEKLFDFIQAPSIKGLIDPKDLNKFKKDIDKAMKMMKKEDDTLTYIKKRKDLNDKQEKSLKKMVSASSEGTHYEIKEFNGYELLFRMEEFGHSAAGNEGSAIGAISFIGLTKKDKVRFRMFLNCKSGMTVKYAIPGTVSIPDFNE